MASAGTQWLIERGVVDPRGLQEMPSIKRRRFEEVADAIRGESVGAFVSITNKQKAIWQVLLEEEKEASGAKWCDLKGPWAAGCEAVYNETFHWTDSMWNHHLRRGGSEEDLEERRWPGVASHRGSQGVSDTTALSAATCASTVVLGEDLGYPDNSIWFFKDGAYQINHRSGAKRPVRRLDINFGSKVYKIARL